VEATRGHGASSRAFPQHSAQRTNLQALDKASTPQCTWAYSQEMSYLHRRGPTSPKGRTPHQGVQLPDESAHTPASPRNLAIVCSSGPQGCAPLMLIRGQLSHVRGRRPALPALRDASLCGSVTRLAQGLLFERNGPRRVRSDEERSERMRLSLHSVPTTPIDRPHWRSILGAVNTAPSRG
jgi:hypothetical protein